MKSSPTDSNSGTSDYRKLRTRIRNLEMKTSNQHQLIQKLERKIRVSKIYSMPMLFKVLIIPVLVLACSYQAFIITDSYLLYDVAAKPLHYPSGIVSPPVLTICIAENFIRPCYNFSCYNSTSEYFDSTPDFEDIVDRLGFVPPGGSWFDTNDTNFIIDFKKFVTRYTIYRRMCFAIDAMKFFNKPHYTDAQVKSNIYRIMYSLRINSKICLSTYGCDLQFASRGDLTTDLYGNRFAANELISFSYSKKKLILLPYPYITNCRDYDAEGLRSQEGCIAQCSKNEYLNKSIAVALNFPITRNSGDYRMSHEFDKISNLCESQCSSKGCVIRQYGIVRKSEDSYFDNKTLLIYSFPDNASLIVYYLPKMTIWEYLTLFSSIFGSWLGLSVLGFTKTGINLVARRTKWSKMSKTVLQ